MNWCTLPLIEINGIIFDESIYIDDYFICYIIGVHPITVLVSKKDYYKNLYAKNPNK